jgi:hypothetical protein
MSDRELRTHQLRNLFVQALGVGTLAYISLMALDWIMIFFLGILETFSRWYRYHASPYAFQIAIGLAVLWVVWSAVFSSRQNP